MNAGKLLFIHIAIALSLVVSGCASPGESASKAAGGLLGASLGVAAAKAMAKLDQKRLRLTDAQTKQRERGYMISFGLLGGAVGSSLAGTAYSRLQAEGKKEREAALFRAAQAAKPQRYGEPNDSNLKGTITPGRRYSDASNNRECVDMEDALNDGKSSDSIFVKYCRDLPEGGWKVATSA